MGDDAVLARTGGVDAVELPAFTDAGTPVEAYDVLGGTAAVMALTVHRSGPQPDSDTAVQHMREASQRLGPAVVDFVLGSLEPLE